MTANSDPSPEFKIRKFIADRLAPDLAGELSVDAQLFQLLDSIEVIRIASFVESEFKIEIDDFEMVPDNLGTIARMVELIERKQAL